ncbi:hypothetical protein FACS1894163_02040 [Spirochaetia bacterium]|nr:hypothetical protein FACS1894163_02040 [Spirochaetia bacterium]
MSDRETRLIEVERVAEAQALLELARYVVRSARSGDDGLTLSGEELLGLEYLLENVQAVIRV